MKTIILFLIAVTFVAPEVTMASSEIFAVARLGRFNPNDSSTGLKEFDTGVDVELGLGKKLNPNLVIEGTVGYQTTSLKTGALELTASAIPLMATTKLMLPINEKVDIFAGAGAGIFMVKVEAKKNQPTCSSSSSYSCSYSSASISDNQSPFGFQLVGGGEFAMSETLSIGASVRFTEAEPKFLDDTTATKIGGTTFNLGLKYLFK